MKQKFLTTLVCALMFMNMTMIVSFAGTESQDIITVDELKIALHQNVSADSIMENTESQVIDEFMEEKIDQAVKVIDGREITADMQMQVDGSLCSRQSIDLGDGCELIVELKDEEKVRSETFPQASLMDTSDSSSKWYGYGNRKFTAKASLKCKVGTVSIYLTNNYILSANGIDEGQCSASCTKVNFSGVITHSAPEITDSIARTPGASDTNVRCDYQLIEKGGNNPKIYRLKSTLGYLDINKTTKQVHVKQSWSLTKISEN